MPDTLRDRLNRRAETDVRSLSQEIVWLLNHALDSLEDKRDPEPMPADHERWS